MQQQIRQMRQQGISVRKIAEALGIARQTVRKCLFGPSRAPEAYSESQTSWHSSLNWKDIASQRGKGVTIKQLHQEYAPNVKYGRFRRQLKQEAPTTPQVVVRQEHSPAQKVEIDYTDGIDLIDALTGEATKTHLFVGSLPFSSYVFGEFTLSQKLPSFIESQERMWAFFGGVTPYVVCDNLKSGVHKAHRYDPDVNPTYCDYANHAGFAVLPARPYRPRDKATVESNIGAIQRSFYQEVRERNFYSLGELNAAFREFLGRFNETTMKDYGVSRAERFSTEKPLLKPLPSLTFELSVWRAAKVHADCHIQVERNFYSVPFSAVGQTVRLRLTERAIEVFSADLQPLAVHQRISGRGRASTHSAHYPDKKLGIRRFEVQHAKTEAERIGPSTARVIQALTEGEYPLKYLRRIQGILRLHSSGHVSTAAMEYASQQALRFSRLRLQYIKACAEYFKSSQGKLRLVRPEREADSLYLHQVGLEAKP